MRRAAIAAVPLVVMVGLGCARASTVAAPMVQVPVESVAATDAQVSSRTASDGRSAGDRVEVEWHGSWFPAVLLEPRGAEWLIHYEGYSDEDDEVVAPNRIRTPRARAPAEGEGEDDDR
jgi:hypothetical protein